VPLGDATDLSLATADIGGAVHDSIIKCYRTFRRSRDALLLIGPTIDRQTEELEIAEAVRRMRGERISGCESRHLRWHRGTGDLV
jgi:hypothetical protein